MSEVPQKAGLYWGRWPTEEKYTKIFEVTGEPPFLEIGVFYIREHDVGRLPRGKVGEIVWGPEVVIPAVINFRRPQ